MGQFITKSLSNYKYLWKGNNRKTRRDVFNIFINHYEEYFLDKETVWINNLEILKTFINNNDKLPSQNCNENIDKNEKLA